MEPRTHLGIDSELVGAPQRLEDGAATVRLVTTQRMVADERGLVHGGFVFGLADYAAMLAVNDPHVVLGTATTKFLRPVVVGDTLTAGARVARVDGKKHTVRVTVRRGEDEVMTGELLCLVPDRHVLDRQKAK